MAAAASIVTGILSQGAGPLFQGISSLINSIKGKNPGDAEKLQQLIETYKDEALQANKEVTLAQINAATQQDATAGENIRAMLGSSDPVVRRAIVMPMWIGSIVLFCNYCLFPIVALWRQLPSVNLPPMFWYLYIFSIGGSVGHGILDKALGQEGVVSKALGGQGGSASILGLKFDSKGD